VRVLAKKFAVCCIVVDVWRKLLILLLVLVGIVALELVKKGHKIMGKVF
jgi:uncharacterized membrane protein